MAWPAIAAAAAQGGGVGLNAVGQLNQLKEGRKDRRWMIQQYLMEVEARRRAAERDKQQQEFQNQMSMGNYGQNMASSAMDIFGAYNRGIGR